MKELCRMKILIEVTAPEILLRKYKRPHEYMTCKSDLQNMINALYLVRGKKREKLHTETNGSVASCPGNDAMTFLG
jgi:hypothetical protein